MLLIYSAIAIIVIAMIYTIYLGYKALTMAVEFWKIHAKEVEKTERNNALFYRDFMRG